MAVKDYLDWPFNRFRHYRRAGVDGLWEVEIDMIDVLVFAISKWICANLNMVSMRTESGIFEYVAHLRFQ